MLQKSCALLFKPILTIQLDCRQRNIPPALLFKLIPTIGLQAANIPCTFAQINPDYWVAGRGISLLQSRYAFVFSHAVLRGFAVDCGGFRLSRHSGRVQPTHARWANPHAVARLAPQVHHGAGRGNWSVSSRGDLEKSKTYVQRAIA